MSPALATAAARVLRPFWLSSSPMLKPWEVGGVLGCVCVVLHPIYVWLKCYKCYNTYKISPLVSVIECFTFIATVRLLYGEELF